MSFSGQGLDATSYYVRLQAISDHPATLTPRRDWQLFDLPEGINKLRSAILEAAGAWIAPE